MDVRILDIDNHVSETNGSNRIFVPVHMKAYLRRIQIMNNEW